MAIYAIRSNVTGAFFCKSKYHKGTISHTLTPRLFSKPHFAARSLKRFREHNASDDLHSDLEIVVVTLTAQRIPEQKELL